MLNAHGGWVLKFGGWVAILVGGWVAKFGEKCLCW